jgi:syntaxin-binding protein 5
LVVVTSNGDGRIYTLDRRDRSSPWTAILSGDLDGIPSAFSDPETSVVIEANTGFRCKADNHGLMTSMDPDHVASKRGDKHWVWVIAGAKGARANLDVNGDRLGKVDFKVGNAVACRMVERTDSSVLVTFTERCQVLVYSLPGLELMHTLDLPFSGKVSVGCVSFLRANLPNLTTTGRL